MFKPAIKVFLVGASGSGKTVIGRRVGSNLLYAHVDTDEEIAQREGKASVADIFQEKGEAFFREMEKNITFELFKSSRDVIVSTGGGLPANEGLMELMLHTGLVIYLRASTYTLWNRLGVGDELKKRPLLWKQGIAALEQLCEARRQMYEKAHSLIDTDDMTVPTSAKRVVDIIQEHVKRQQLINPEWDL